MQSLLLWSGPVKKFDKSSCLIMSQLQASHFPLRWKAWILALLGFRESAVWCSWMVKNTQWCHSKVNTVDWKENESEWRFMIKVLTSCLFPWSLSDILNCPWLLSHSALPSKAKWKPQFLDTSLRLWQDHNIGGNVACILSSIICSKALLFTWTEQERKQLLKGHG